VGESWRSDLEERPSGREDGRTKIGNLPKQTLKLIPAIKPLSRPSAAWPSLLASVPAWLQTMRLGGSDCDSVPDQRLTTPLLIESVLRLFSAANCQFPCDTLFE
jgi:hypothetical protein